MDLCEQTWERGYWKFRTSIFLEILMNESLIMLNTFLLDSRPSQ